MSAMSVVPIHCFYDDPHSTVVTGGRPLISPSHREDPYSRWPYFLRPESCGGPEPEFKVVNDDESFRVYLHAEDFRPDEIKVKVVGDMLFIHGKHEKRDYHGFSAISKQFSRRFEIPQDVDKEAMVCNFFADGRLFLKVDKQKAMA